MRKLALTLLTVSHIALPAAHATVIGFENFYPANCCGAIDNAYQSFNWSGSYGSGSWLIAHEADALFSGDTAHSGTAFVWSNGGLGTLTISGPVFSLDSMWIRVSAYSSRAYFYGYANGVELFSSNFEANSSYHFVALNFGNIDTLRIYTNGRNFLIDDITVNSQDIPEPTASTIFMFGLGLLGLLNARSMIRPLKPE
jgi:hypothetical protein